MNVKILYYNIFQPFRDLYTLSHIVTQGIYLIRYGQNVFIEIMV